MSSFPDKIPVMALRYDVCLHDEVETQGGILVVRGLAVDDRSPTDVIPN